ncbi:MAG: LuxR C-terminal-related transcriptional regulator [Legionellaceae bacterium]|nr:LuxR C-terminal-related transcriptional regulator [Legionellaceae bacterium]
MGPTSFQEFMRYVQAPIPLSELLPSMTQTDHQCLFVKDAQSRYLFANANFIQLMGLKNLQQLRHSSDQELSTNKQDAKKYRELDCCILEEERALEVQESIAPKKNQPIIKTMQGKLYPLFSESKQHDGYVLGIVTPESKLLKLDWDSVFRLTSQEIRELLVKRSFPLTLPWGDIVLSKMEILTLIELLKGQHAGEIACVLGLKQTTIESYLMNIKNKLGVNQRSELIQVVTQNQLLQQIIL